MRESEIEKEIKTEDVVEIGKRLVKRREARDGENEGTRHDFLKRIVKKCRNRSIEGSSRGVHKSVRNRSRKE